MVTEGFETSVKIAGVCVIFLIMKSKPTVEDLCTKMFGMVPRPGDFISFLRSETGIVDGKKVVFGSKRIREVASLVEMDIPPCYGGKPFLRLLVKLATGETKEIYACDKPKFSSLRGV